MTTNKTNDSPSAKAWKRLKKNKAAMFGLGFIILNIMIAVFAYFITPDSTTNADEQILQLETHSPGFTIHILEVRRDKKIEVKNWVGRSWDRLIDGQVSQYESIPFLSYKFEGPDMILQEYKGINFPPAERKISMIDILYANSLVDDTVRYERGQAIFKDIDNQVQTVALAGLSQKIEKENVIKKKYWLGTDKFGRDILSRMILGTRVSLSVGLVSVIISFLIGVLLGSLAGYYGGWIDSIVMWFITVFWSIPTFLLALGLSLSLSPEFIKTIFHVDTGDSFKYILIFIAVGLTMWVDMARMVRSQFMSVREKEYVEAAKSLGFGNYRTIVKHILPNILGPVIVVLAADFAAAILTESALSYLGLGVQPPKASWGQMLNEYKDFLNTNKAYLTIIPGVAIMLLVLAFNLIGNGLRDALDVRAGTN